MRSRDGNYSFLFTIFTLIIFSSVALNATEYLISYRYVVKNSLLLNEKFQISKAMQKCKGKVYDKITLVKKKSDTLKEVLSNSEGEFIPYIHKLGIEVKSSDTTQNFINSSTTIITLKTTCFKVDVNENFVIIAPLK